MKTHQAQRDRILEALQRGPLTVDDIRDELHIGLPSTRICELRKAGIPIATIRLPGQKSSTYMLTGENA